MDLYKVIIPVLVVPGQTDDMILGSNAIKWLISQMKKTLSGQDIGSTVNSAQSAELPHLVSLLSFSDEWENGAIPHKIGTAKLKRCVTLRPMSEHLVWAKLPAFDVSAVEYSHHRTHPVQGQTSTNSGGESCHLLMG